MDNNRNWKNIWDKVIVVIVAFIMVFTQIPFNQGVYAKTNMALVKIAKHSAYSHKNI